MNRVKVKARDKTIEMGEGPRPYQFQLLVQFYNAVGHQKLDAWSMEKDRPRKPRRGPNAIPVMVARENRTKEKELSKVAKVKRLSKLRGREIKLMVILTR
ncbi:hypothetical protein IMY05_011G0037000 [Salix suchowensis]|nr:hypothetical protein IMY05_011G0037000 [Salix suchowensis]